MLWRRLDDGKRLVTHKVAEIGIQRAESEELLGVEEGGEGGGGD